MGMKQNPRVGGDAVEERGVEDVGRGTRRGLNGVSRLTLAVSWAERDRKTGSSSVIIKVVIVVKVRDYKLSSWNIKRVCRLAQSVRSVRASVLPDKLRTGL